MTKKHARLSASSSARWLNCPGSIEAAERYEQTSSVFADEGTLAHELADRCLSKDKDADSHIGNDIHHYVDDALCSSLYAHGITKIEKDMADYVQSYLDYVRSFETQETILYTERTVDFSHVVPEGFGTTDAAVLNSDTRELHIFDLKYGKGVVVDAYKNTQAQLYALGFHNELGFLSDFDTITVHIVQPRVGNFSEWTITLEELEEFGRWVSERAQLALSPNAPRVPGDKQCQWCPAKADCKALADFTHKVIAMDFDDLTECDTQTLSDDHKRTILENTGIIKSFLDAVHDSVYKKVLDGETFQGYKLVEGRSVSKWSDEAEEQLEELLGSDAYNKKLIGVTEAKKRLGKDVVEGLTFKPKGKLTLVPNSDKRKSVGGDDIINEFDIV